MYILEFLFSITGDLVLTGIFVLLGVLIRNHREVVNYFQNRPEQFAPTPPFNAGQPPSKVAGWFNLLSICFFVLAGVKALNMLGSSWSMFSYY